MTGVRRLERITPEEAWRRQWALDLRADRLRWSARRHRVTPGERDALRRRAREAAERAGDLRVQVKGPQAR